MVRTCSKCKSNMHRVNKMNSGNAVYETWQCDTCDFREQFCTGIQ